jgi:hypothetical protein
LDGANVEDNAVEPAVAEALDVNDAATVEPVVLEIAAVAENQSIEENLGSAWVVPEDSGVPVRRSGRVIAASDTLGTCWIRVRGQNFRRSRRLS